MLMWTHPQLLTLNKLYNTYAADEKKYHFRFLPNLHCWLFPATQKKVKRWFYHVWNTGWTKCFIFDRLMITWSIVNNVGRCCIYSKVCWKYVYSYIYAGMRWWLVALILNYLQSFVNTFSFCLSFWRSSMNSGSLVFNVSGKRDATKPDPTAIAQ